MLATLPPPALLNRLSASRPLSPAPCLRAQETAPVLLKEIHSPCSRLRPYMDVLPKPGGVLTGYNFPEEYVPYLGDQHMVRTLWGATGPRRARRPRGQGVEGLRGRGDRQ